MSEIVTAAMLVIGDEILSGRTKDRNIGHLAEIMTAIGIDLKEVRIVADDEDEIVAAINALRATATTTCSPPAASARRMTTSPPIPSPKLLACRANMTRKPMPCWRRTTPSARWNSPRPASAWRECRAAPTHIDNPVSVAPGFRIGNVHAMAGVPAIFQAMLDNVVPTLKNRRQTALGDRRVPVRRGGHRRPAGRHPEGAPRHDHRLLSQISGRQVLDRAGGARAQPAKRSTAPESAVRHVQAMVDPG